MRQDSIHDMITNDKTHLTRSSSAQGQLVSWVETGLSGRVTYLSWVLWSFTSQQCGYQLPVQNYIIATKRFTVWFLCVCVCTYLRLVLLLFVFVFIFFLFLSILYISKEKVLDKIYLIFWLNPWTIYSKIQDGWWYLVSCIFI